MTEVNIPKFDEFLAPILRYANDDREHTVSDTIEEMSRQFALSEAQKNLLMPNGKVTYLYNRINWAITYLVSAGLLVRTSRAKYRISEKGKEEVKIMPERITKKYLEKFESFVEFTETRHPARPNKIKLTSDEDIDKIFNDRNSILAKELLEILTSIKPSDFERVVIDLVLSLGYGKDFKEMAQVLGQPHDQGVDGVIFQDKLGFEKIYLQAKRWGIDRTIEAGEVMKFMGALDRKHAKKGIFITTAKFSNEAKKAAKEDPEHVIKIIDGTELARLMIENNIGVRKTNTYELKEIDKDYFESL
jgi:restriction system protein